MRRETAEGENYLGMKIFRFYFRYVYMSFDEFAVTGKVCAYFQMSKLSRGDLVQNRHRECRLFSRTRCYTPLRSVQT